MARLLVFLTEARPGGSPSTALAAARQCKRGGDRLQPTASSTGRTEHNAEHEESGAVRSAGGSGASALKESGELRRTPGHPTHVPLPGDGLPQAVAALTDVDAVAARRRREATPVQCESMEASLPRFRRLAVSAQSFRRLALANAVILVLIVASGATVRLTGSGLGCEHWPGCEAGDPFPKTGYHSYVEFSNRIESGFVILVTLATFLASLRVPELERWVRWVAGAAFVASLLQAPLGAVTVHYKLNPYLVGTHFLLSIVALTFGILVALEAWNIRGEPVSRGLRWLAMVAGAPVARCSSAACSRPRRDRIRAARRFHASGGSSRPSTSTSARPHSSHSRSRR